MTAPATPSHPAPDAPPLVFDQVSYWYGDVVAVNAISATVQPGITGLLGPNGAGKTTLLQLAAGLLSPKSGTVAVGGETPSAHPSIYRQVALVPAREALPGALTPRQFVAARATMLGLSDVPGATAAALALVELEREASRPIEGFSKGMRQRTKLAAALVHSPNLLLLDEPFNGLDPRQRMQLLAVLEARAAAGTAVLLSSHILEEIEPVASTMLVMVAGRLAASGDYRTLRRLMTDRPHTLRVRSSDDRRLGARLLTEPSVVAIELTAEGLLVRTTDFTRLAHGLAPAAQALAVTVLAVQPTDESLEHVFAYLVGDPARSA